MSSGNQNNDIMTYEECAVYLKVKPSQIRHLTSKKAIPHSHIGRHVRYLKSEIDAWLLRSTIPASKPTQLSLSKLLEKNG